ncbi:MAG: crossover junction endodeoxyribonuclease RuvC [Bacteroidetes bacterium]|nr:crossover junction endodeoxyribonuclease RuvC [Bacteroidota bacterium]
MGIDPGTNKMGYALISVIGKKATFLNMGYLKVPSTLSAYDKLLVIFQRVEELMIEFSPSEVAYEAPFYGENIQSMLKLGRAQGVAMVAASKHGAKVFEYAPRKIKLAITGTGGASKGQVANLLKAIFKFKELPENQDSTDALAIAMCHFYQNTNVANNKSSHKSWEDYVKANPEKIR